MMVKYKEDMGQSVDDLELVRKACFIIDTVDCVADRYKSQHANHGSRHSYSNSISQAESRKKDLAREACIQSCDLLEFIVLVSQSEFSLFKLFIDKNMDLLQDEEKRTKETYIQVLN